MTGSSGDGSRGNLGISVVVAVGVGILVARLLEPTWGLWGFAAAMAAATLVVVGIGALFGRK